MKLINGNDSNNAVSKSATGQRHSSGVLTRSREGMKPAGAKRMSIKLRESLRNGRRMYNPQDMTMTLGR